MPKQTLKRVVLINNIYALVMETAGLDAPECVAADALCLFLGAMFQLHGYAAVLGWFIDIFGPIVRAADAAYIQWRDGDLDVDKSQRPFKARVGPQTGCKNFTKALKLLGASPVSKPAVVPVQTFSGVVAKIASSVFNETAAFVLALAAEAPAAFATGFLSVISLDHRRTQHKSIGTQSDPIQDISIPAPPPPPRKKCLPLPFVRSRAPSPPSPLRVLEAARSKLLYRAVPTFPLSLSALPFRSPVWLPRSAYERFGPSHERTLGPVRTTREPKHNLILPGTPFLLKGKASQYYTDSWNLV
ncbi:hypothetical protein C8R43DRAFT_1242347 [Mycena crocata]|nr:hypothetical protein C8R43DRAFT_1242347 [Mycena crocata]